MSEQQIIEITGYGFDGSTDSTDDRVIWVLAPGWEYVTDVIDNCHATCWGRVVGSEGMEDELADCVEFELPRDDQKLIQKLKGWAPV